MKKEIVLSPRLSVLRDWVSQGARVVDVGTDHGFLPASLILNGICTFAIAADIGEGPLQSARQTGEKYGITDQLMFVLSDGLEQISGDAVDTIVIAGMGGETIIHILEIATWTRNPAYTLLLQPMSKIEMLRLYLAQNGYQIQREQLVEEGRFLYHTMQVRGGGTPQMELEPLLQYGSQALWESGQPLLEKYCDGLIRKLDRAIEGLRKSEQPETADRIRRLEEERTALIQKKGAL